MDPRQGFALDLEGVAHVAAARRGEGVFLPPCGGGRSGAAISGKLLRLIQR